MPALPRYVVSLLLMLLMLPIGCGSEDPGTIQNDTALSESELQDTAQETVRQMLNLTEEGNWWELIENYYGEIEKIENDKQHASLQNAFEHGLGRKLIPVLEQAAEITPVIEDGKALFQVDGETIYMLYQNEDGTWGFHL